jgi:CubicO group peptidase (beta-lactamase class C family)
MTTAQLLLLAVLLAGASWGPAAATPRPVTESTRAEVRAYLETVARDEGWSGVILIAVGEEIVFHEAYGLAEVELRVPMRTDHRFRIGSLTKPVTASALLVAVDRGLLSLDERVCDRLPFCPSAWREVTLRHLLSHTSGIADHFGDLEAVPVGETFAELTRVLRDLPEGEALAFPPGSAYAYSNFNYVLLGAVLEKATGRLWEDALRTLVFEPLGVATMAYDDVYAIVPDRVRGYTKDDALGLRNIDVDDHAAYAAGGLLATSGDLFRWSRGVFGGKLFRPELVTESLTPVQDDYGYGWQIRRFFDRPVVNHTGGIDGFSSHLAWYPEDGVTLVVLTNIESDSAILRACDLAGILFGRWTAADPTRRDLTPRERCGLKPP